MRDPNRALRYEIQAILNVTAGEIARGIKEGVERAVAQAWDEGAEAGWKAGVSDANDEEPVPLEPNPYRK